jgi:hypothetical protein
MSPPTPVSREQRRDGTEVTFVDQDWRQSDSVDEVEAQRVDSPTGPRRSRFDNAAFRRLSIGVTLLWFPLLYMWPVLAPGSTSHLRSPRADPNQLTDLDGAIWFARALRNMPFPWSESVMTAAPTGESIWRWQTMTQALQVVSLWGFTRVLEPAHAVNVFVLLGWIVTGIAGYLLARSVGAGVFIALGAGVLCQMLPSIPTMASNFTSYVYVGVPLLVLTAAITVMTDPSWMRIAILATSLAFTAFFDPYWLFFSLAIVAMAAAVNARTLVSWFAAQPRTLRLVLARQSVRTRCARRRRRRS